MSRSTVATVTSETGACWSLGCVTHVFINGHNFLLLEHNEKMSTGSQDACLKNNIFF